MTKEKTEKVLYKLPDGETFDVEGAFARHPALSTVEAVVERRSPDDIQFSITAGPWTMARLVQILNSAPADGDPLQAIVDLDLCTTTSEAEREALVDYLGSVGQDPTVENVATAYIHEATRDKPLELDVRLSAISGKYAVTRIASRYDSETEHISCRGKCLSHIDFTIPADPTDAGPKLVTVVSEKAPISIEDLEGNTISGRWRIIRALKPVKEAPHGGFILEYSGTPEEE